MKFFLFTTTRKNKNENENKNLKNYMKKAQVLILRQSFKYKPKITVQWLQHDHS